MKSRLLPRLGSDGAHFTRPMHVRLPRKTHRACRTSRPAAFNDAGESSNRRYAGDGFLFCTEPTAWLRGHAGVLPSKGRVVSVADGEGRNSVGLAQQGFQVDDAFEVSDRAVAKALSFIECQGGAVNFSVAGVDGCAWPQVAYDGAVASFVQLAGPDMRSRLFGRIVCSLKRGGVLVLQGHTPKQMAYRPGGPPVLSHLHTRELLEAAFTELSTVVLHECEAEVHEGQGHRGQSALVGWVARR